MITPQKAAELRSRLIVAVDDRKYDLVKSILFSEDASLRGDPNTKTDGGIPLISIVAFRGEEKILKIFAGAGANLNLPDPDGKRPLDWAKAGRLGRGEDDTIVRYLKDSGAKESIGVVGRVWNWLRGEDRPRSRAKLATQ